MFQRRCYRDFGKTAFTLTRRNGEGLRIAVKPDCLEEQAPEAAALFRKVVVERRGSEADQARVRELWVETSFKMLDVPDAQVFVIKSVKVNVPAYARIFSSSKCAVCGESIMEPRSRLKDGKVVCLACSGQAYYQLAGDGIAVVS